MGSFSFVVSAQRRQEAERVLEKLGSGEVKSIAALESATVDIKEEAGRRSPSGEILPGIEHNEEAAKQLAKAAACMANSPGGGVLIVGVDDRTAQIIGAKTDPHWLRSRIYDLTNQKLTVDIDRVAIGEHILLAIEVSQAVEPVPYRNKYLHRVDARCVPATLTELVTGLFFGLAADPSYQPSGTPITNVTAAAEKSLRDQIAEHDPRKAELPRLDLFGRLGLIAGDGVHLNIAGEIMLAARERPSIDYMHRHVPGGPSTIRIDKGGRSMIEEILEVESEAKRNNPVREVTIGFQVHRVRAIPNRSLREAILNACCHRDWSIHGPTVVEHIGNHFYVTSPGGLIGGVREDNIITHPSVPRYRTLMDAMRQTGLVEREGVGIDHLFADMIRIGSLPPIVETLADPAVRITLLGRPVNENWFRLFADLSPITGRDDVDAALLVWRAAQGKSLFLTGHSCGPLLQRGPASAEAALNRVASYTLRSPDDTSLLTPMRTLPDTPPAWTLSKAARASLGLPVSIASPESALAWARERGRISSTEYRQMTGVSMATATKHLKVLAEEGRLEPSSETGRGRGFHYRPVLNRTVAAPNARPGDGRSSWR